MPGDATVDCFVPSSNTLIRDSVGEKLALKIKYSCCVCFVQQTKIYCLVLFIYLIPDVPQVLQDVEQLIIRRSATSLSCLKRFSATSFQLCDTLFIGCAGDGRMGMDSIGVIWVCGGLLSTRIHIKRGC